MPLPSLIVTPDSNDIIDLHPRPLSKQQRAAMFYEQAYRHRHDEFTLNNITKSLRGWSHYSGIPMHNLYQRLYKLHWPLDKAINTKLQRRDKLSPPKSPPKPLDFSPFLSPLPFQALLISPDSPPELVASHLLCDLHNHLWFWQPHPHITSPSRLDLTLQIMSIDHSTSPPSVDHDLLSCLQQSSLAIKFQRMELT